MNTFFQTERLFRLTDITSANEVKLRSLHALRYWQKRTRCCGHIVAHDVSWVAQTGRHLLRTQNVSEQSQKRFLCSGHKMLRARANGETFVSATMQQCVRNNVSSFAKAFSFPCELAFAALVFPSSTVSWVAKIFWIFRFVYGSNFSQSFS